jgi:hypothetical protein
MEASRRVGSVETSLALSSKKRMEDKAFFCYDKNHLE